MRYFSALILICLGLWFAPQQRMVGMPDPESAVVTTGQVVRPAGKQVTTNSRPVDLALTPDRKFAVVKDNRGLILIDAAGWTIKQELKFPSGGGSMHGVAVSRDGNLVYATDAASGLHEAKLEAGKLAWTRRIELGTAPVGGPSYGCGIALSRDGSKALVCLSRSNSLAVVDLTSGKKQSEVSVGIAPYDVVLSPDEARAYVSNWGGRRPREGELVAPSAGSPVLVDERGVGSSGTVSIVDLTEKKAVAEIESGLHPSDIVISRDGGRIYVANANDDTVSVIDAVAGRKLSSVVVKPDDALPFGSAPTGLCLSADEKRLFVALGGNNAVAVVSLSDKGGSVAGLIPTSWYPGAVATDGSNLFVPNVKGFGSRFDHERTVNWKVYAYLGAVSRIPIPNSTTLARFTAKVKADGLVPEVLAAQNRSKIRAKSLPIPAKAGDPSVFQHVVYIIKENRTYDQVFGDLPQGNGNKGLCIFGRDVTPNHHALAEQFVLLDNFYCNGVNSADGHQWATEGNTTDHLEKSFGGFARSYTFGDDPLTYSSTGFIWDRILATGRSFRNFGEMDYTDETPDSSFEQILADHNNKTNKITFKHRVGIDRLKRYSSPTYPGWNMDIPDVVRADYFLKEFKAMEQSGQFPNFTILYLPNDHTTGQTPGSPTARAYLADNDLALGRVIDAISHSRFWPKTCIFVVEDDPQAGFDHVDGHRSIGLVVSPYTKRKTVVGRFYNQTSVLHSISRIFGLPGMNQMDSMAPLMTECFTSTPNLTPFTHLPNQVPLDEKNRATSARGLVPRTDYAKPDAIDDNGLNREVWAAMRGSSRYPVEYAGAHGKGLRGLGLRLAPGARQDIDD